MLAPTYSLPLRSEYLFKLQQSVAQNPLSYMRPSFIEIGTVQLRSDTEIAPKPIFNAILMIDATIGNQAFSHVRCYIFPGLSYNMADNTFFYSLRKNDVEAKVEFTLKIGKGLGYLLLM